MSSKNGIQVEDLKFPKKKIKHSKFIKYTFKKSMKNSDRWKGFARVLMRSASYENSFVMVFWTIESFTERANSAIMNSKSPTVTVARVSLLFGATRKIIHVIYRPHSRNAKYLDGKELFK